MYKGFKEILLSYLVYYKNCVNLLVDDYQFGYITKLKKKNCDHNILVVYIENLLQKARLFKACLFLSIAHYVG
jgi:hypothetical protein